MRLDFTLSYCIFLASGRDNPADFVGSAFAGKVFTFHHDLSHLIDLGHRLCTQRPFQVTACLANSLFNFY